MSDPRGKAGQTKVPPTLDNSHCNQHLLRHFEHRQGHHPPDDIRCSQRYSRFGSRHLLVHRGLVLEEGAGGGCHSRALLRIQKLVEPHQDIHQMEQEPGHSNGVYRPYCELEKGQNISGGAKGPGNNF